MYVQGHDAMHDKLCPLLLTPRQPGEEHTKKIKTIILRTSVGLQPQLLNQTGQQSLTHVLGMAFPRYRSFPPTPTQENHPNGPNILRGVLRPRTQVDKDVERIISGLQGITRVLLVCPVVVANQKNHKGIRKGCTPRVIQPSL